MTYARHSWQLSSEGSLACLTYCDTGHPYIMVISDDRPVTHTPIGEVWQQSCHFFFFTKQFYGLWSFSPDAEFILTRHFCPVPLIYWRCCPYEWDRNNICDGCGESHFSRTDSSSPCTLHRKLEQRKRRVISADIS